MDTIANLPKGLVFNPFDHFPTDHYDSDVDPDSNFFSLFDLSKICSLYSSNQFNNLCALIPQNIFSTFHLNTRSLSNKYDKFVHYLSSLKHEFSVIALSETWLTEDTKDYFKLPNYNAVHHIRQNRPGGGVSLFIHGNYEYKPRDDICLKSDMTEVEAVFVELSGAYGGRNIIVGAIYRPPDSSIKDFNDMLLGSFDKIIKENKLCFILGDFNIDLFKNKLDNPIGDFLNTLYSNFFFPLINKSTRVTESSETLIDNILTNSLNGDIKSGVLYSDLSDHFPIFQFSLKTSRANQTQKIIYKTIMSKSNIDKFKEMLAHISWNDLYKEYNADLAYQLFMKIINATFNQCFPSSAPSKKHTRNLNKPWFTTELQKLLRKKNKLFKKYISNSIPSTHDSYKSYRNKYNHSIRSAKKKYFSEEFKKCLNDSKTTWKVINQLLQRERATYVLPSVLSEGKNSFNNSEDIAQKFNNFFVNIGSKLANKIPACQGNPLDFISSDFPPFSSFEPPDTQEISDLIDELKLSAAGHDNISAFLVKQVKEHILQPLVHILSLSLKTGIVPDDLKLAKVIPLFKADDPCCFNNYRPISILPCFSKILEKIVYKRMLNHLNSNAILYKHQYGFRKNHSTYMALLHLIDKVSSALENNEFCCSIFIDFSKAFDTVNHVILLNKLYKYGFHDITHKWLKNYISNRRQFVHVKGCFSDKAELLCGVPQGSILGPLLFLIYINDMFNASNLLSPIMFADDTTLLLSHSNFHSLIKEANVGLAAYASWFNLNKLSLNIKKSNFIIFSGRKKYFEEVSKIFINSIEMPKVSSTRFLGVYVDENLNWRVQIDSIYKKINKSIGIIRRISHLVNTSCLLTLYYSLIYPYLTYCNLVWASTFPTSLHKILVLQKRFIRIASRSESRASSGPLFQKHQILNIYNINIYQICIFIYKIQSSEGNIPVQFITYFKKKSSSHSFSTRQSLHLHLPKFLTSRGQFAIKYRGAKIWNDFLHLPKKSSLNTYKKSLKKYLTTVM